MPEISPPPWSAEPISYGPVVLRELSDLDVPMIQELSTDPYVPLIGGIPPHASQQQAQDWIDRQHGPIARARASRSPSSKPAPAVP